jgi:hypothetical protein
VKAKRILVLVVFAVSVIAAIWLYLLWYAPPLRRTKNFRISYSITGQIHSDAEVFQPFGVPSRCYILIPSPPVPDYYHWFVVDFSRRLVALPSFGVTCPCGSPCMHRDQEIGIVIPDMQKKIGDDIWQVSVDSNGANFSDGNLSVTLTKIR